MSNKEKGLISMIYSGIDIASFNHLAFVSSDGKMLIELFQFSNAYEGFRNISRPR